MPKNGRRRQGVGGRLAYPRRRTVSLMAPGASPCPVRFQPRQGRENGSSGVSFAPGGAERKKQTRRGPGVAHPRLAPWATILRPIRGANNADRPAPCCHKPRGSDLAANRHPEAATGAAPLAASGRVEDARLSPRRLPRAYMREQSRSCAASGKNLRELPGFAGNVGVGSDQLPRAAREGGLQHRATRRPRAPRRLATCRRLLVAP